MTAVVLVDDQPLVRAGLQRILSEEEGFTVVAQCSDGAAAVAAIESAPADVVLMDVRMRGMDGIEATRRLRKMDGPPVLVLTTFDDDEVLWGAIDAGAAGFVLKEASAEDLIAATRTVASGGAWLDPAVTARVLEVTRSTGLRRQREADKATLLTDRELDVLRHMATGATNGEIAGVLFVSEATVKTHVGSIFGQVGCPGPGRRHRVRLPARDRLADRVAGGSPPPPPPPPGGGQDSTMARCASTEPPSWWLVAGGARRMGRDPEW